MKPEDFKIWRKTYRMTQPHAGALLGGITKRTIIYWEQGRVPIGPTAVFAIKCFEMLPEDNRLELIETARHRR